MHTQDIRCAHFPKAQIYSAFVRLKKEKIQRHHTTMHRLFGYPYTWVLTDVVSSAVISKGVIIVWGYVSVCLCACVCMCVCVSVSLCVIEPVWAWLYQPSLCSLSISPERRPVGRHCLSCTGRQTRLLLLNTPWATLETAAALSLYTHIHTQLNLKAHTHTKTIWRMNHKQRPRKIERGPSCFPTNVPSGMGPISTRTDQTAFDEWIDILSCHFPYTLQW